MGLSLQLDEGLRISISGFTDKQPELLAAALSALRVSPDEQALTQALDRFFAGVAKSQARNAGQPTRPDLVGPDTNGFL